MPKAKGLLARAYDHAIKHRLLYPEYACHFADGAVYGHRANRLTKAERAVVEAAVAWDKGVNIAPLLRALNALERAKGRK